MAFDVVTYILSKKYVDRVIESLPTGFHYKGAVNYKHDLPSSAEVGDVYIVVYDGESGTTPLGAQFAWGPYEGTNQWIQIGKGGSDFNVKHIDITGWTEGTTGTLTEEQFNIIKENPFNYIQVNGIYKFDLSLWDDTNDSATYVNTNMNSISYINLTLSTRVYNIHHTELPYSAPAIAQLVLRGEGVDLAGSYEFGSEVRINGIKHYETNVGNIRGDLVLSDGGTVLANNIVKSASSVVVLLASSIPLDGQHGGKTLTLSGTNTKSTTFSKTASVSFSDYDYCQFAGDATIPTDGASLSTAAKGGTFNVTYVAGKCIRFITQKTSGTIQQSVLGTWTDVDTVDEGTVTFTQKNGFVRTYHVFRTDFYEGSGTGSYKFN